MNLKKNRVKHFFIILFFISILAAPSPPPLTNKKTLCYSEKKERESQKYFFIFSCEKKGNFILFFPLSFFPLHSSPRRVYGRWLFIMKNEIIYILYKFLAKSSSSLPSKAHSLFQFNFNFLFLEKKTLWLTLLLFLSSSYISL